MNELQAFLNSDVPGFALFFVAAASLFVALFHSMIIPAILGTERKMRWPFFVYPAAILCTGFLISGPYGILIFLGLFFSTFILAILLMIVGIFRSGMDKAKAKNPKAPLPRRMLNGLAAVALVVAFYATFMISPAFLFLVFFILFPFVQSLFPSNRKYFYNSQRSLPTSTVRSLPMGLAEICGKAEHIDLMTSPLKKKPCIGYYYTKEDISTDKDGHTSYHTVFSETKCNSFYLNDGTGKILVTDEVPEFIDFEIDHQYSAGQRFTQYLLTDGMEVLLVGAAKTGQNNAAVFGREESRKIFGISPAAKVEEYNRMRPVRQAAAIFAYIFAMLVALILITPIHLKNGRLIIEKIQIWKPSANSYPKD